VFPKNYNFTKDGNKKNKPPKITSRRSEGKREGSLALNRKSLLLWRPKGHKIL
jgi:hypothetical protein